MRISDIVNEAGFLAGYQKGKAIANKTLSPSKWIQNTEFGKGYDSGYDKMDKLLTPSRWLEPGKEKASSTKQPHSSVVKQALVRVSNGENLYRTDIEILKQVKERVEDKEIKTPDPKFTSLALKAAINRQTLSDQQRKDLQALAQQI